MDGLVPENVHTYNPWDLLSSRTVRRRSRKRTWKSNMRASPASRFHASICGIEGGVGMKNYVVIGGGIAGVCCAQELARLAPSIDPSIRVVLITASNYVMEVRSFIYSRRAINSPLFILFYHNTTVTQYLYRHGTSRRSIRVREED